MAAEQAPRRGPSQGHLIVGFPVERPRRLRRTPALRRLVAETRLHPAGLVLPLFVREGLADPAPISSLPGVVQHSRESLRAAAAEAAYLGLGGVMLFAVPEHRDAEGSAATDPASPRSARNSA